MLVSPSGQSWKQTCGNLLLLRVSQDVTQVGADGHKRGGNDTRVVSETETSIDYNPKISLRQQCFKAAAALNSRDRSGDRQEVDEPCQLLSQSTDQRSARLSAQFYVIADFSRKTRLFCRFTGHQLGIVEP